MLEILIIVIVSLFILSLVPYLVSIIVMTFFYGMCGKVPPIGDINIKEYYKDLFEIIRK